MKLCKDCKHLGLAGWCQHPKLGINTVTGGPQSARAGQIRGTQVRCADDWTRCGPEAIWFEPKPVTKLSEVLAWLSQK